MWSQSIEVTAGQVVVASCEVTATEAGQGVRLTVEPLGLEILVYSDGSTFCVSKPELISELQILRLLPDMPNTVRAALTLLSSNAQTLTFISESVGGSEINTVSIDKREGV